MTHHYGQPIALTCDQQGQPVHFIWRGHVYAVLAILTSWRLRDRWWVRGQSAPVGGTRSDRTYYRLHCQIQGAGDAYIELYHDLISNTWVLDRIYD
jgi:hypothetical protein